MTRRISGMAWLAALLFAVTSFSACMQPAFRRDRDTVQPLASNTTIAARGYSLMRPDPDYDYEGYQPPDIWPMMEEVDERYRDTPEAKERWIRFCYFDDASMNNLWRAMIHAVAMWSPAYEYSTMRIMPDPDCNKNGKPDWKCVCGSNTRRDVLRVVETVVSGDKIYNGEKTPPYSTSSSVGYRKPHVAGPPNVLFMGHWVLTEGSVALNKWPKQKGQKLTPGWGDQGDYIATYVSLAHELGHTIGLMHEHQKPGAADYVAFDCRNLNGYDEALRSIEVDEKKLYAKEPKMSATERLDRLCAEPVDGAWWVVEEKYAYWPLLAQYAPFLHFHVGVWFPESRDFDYKSIMLYDSDENVRDGAQSWPIAKHPSKVLPGETAELLMGGSDRWPKKSISIGDITAVANLYTTGEIRQDIIQAAPGSALERMKEFKVQTFIVPQTFTSVVRPAPTVAKGVKVAD